MKKKNPFKKNKHEILYNLINCGLAGGLVFIGSLSSGEITSQGLGFSVLAFLLAFFTKFKDYWKTQKPEYTTKVFNFIQM